MMRLMRPKRGFTMIELVLYLALAGVVGVVVFSLLSSLQQGRAKYQTITEVEQDGARLAQHIGQTIRNADVITNPAAGVSASGLTLDMYDAPVDPTVYSLANGVVSVSESGQAAVALSSSRVTVSGLSFTNLSAPNTPGIIRFQFTVAHRNTGNRNQYEYSQAFYGSAALR